MKTEADAHEEWVTYGFPDKQPMWRSIVMARHVVSQFADAVQEEKITSPERVPVQVSPEPLKPYAITRIGERTHTVKYDEPLAARPPCMVVGSIVHELFHVLVWDSLPRIAGVDADALTDNEHEVLVVAAEHLCLFPGVADLTFDVMDEAWATRMHYIHPSLTAMGHATAIKARVEAMGESHTEPMMPETAARVFRTMLCQFTHDRGYRHGE